MSYKGSKSRVQDKKSFDETMDQINWDSKKRKSKKKVQNKLYGLATRYYYDR